VAGSTHGKEGKVVDPDSVALRSPEYQIIYIKPSHKTGRSRRRHAHQFRHAFLRSYVAGIELGSFARAADKVGRSTSAVSAQLKKLEEQAGVPLFRKDGRGLALTQAGEVLLAMRAACWNSMTRRPSPCAA
jgi:biotin operon repressor